MLTKYDEMLCHQTVSTFDHPASSAKEWTERIWFMAHDTTGEVILVAGFGLYPNRNIIDAFVCLAIEGKTQHVVRASRELRPRIDEVNVGPFAWDIVEPMKKLRASLGENEYGISYDILFEATAPALEEDPPQFSRFRGRVVEDIQRFFQVGKPSGWIKIDGRTINVDQISWRAERDRSWGIRHGAAEYMETAVQQPGEVPVGFFYNGACWQFDDWGASYHIREGWDGKISEFSGGLFYPFAKGQEVTKLSSIEHQFTFRSDIPGLRQVNGGKVILNVADGSRKEAIVKPLGAIYIGTGGYSYANYRGFTHGQWKGSSWIDGFKLDLTDPNVLREITYLDELVCEVCCGDDVGYGLTEVIAIGKYLKYGYQGF